MNLEHSFLFYGSQVDFFDFFGATIIAGFWMTDERFRYSEPR